MSITLKTVSSGYNLSTINANFQSLQAALNNNILWRTGSVAGEAQMSRDLDMDGHYLLNVGVDLNNPGSLITIEAGDARYYNIIGDTLQGELNAGGYRLTGIGMPLGPSDALRRQELDVEVAARQQADSSLSTAISTETTARQNADANLQAQITGSTPLEASAFSEISWHGQEIGNSVTIPADKNAWSFGPQMEISTGQAVTISEGSSWTIANGRVVEDEDLHNLIADTLTTSDGNTIVQVSQLAVDADVTAVQAQVSNNTAAIGVNSSNISALTSRMDAEEAKVQSVALGGTGATTAAAARTNLGAAASGANTDITSITGSAATLTASRTFQTNLASTTAASFNGSANNVHGVTGVLPITNGGTGGATAGAARIALGAAASAGVVDGSDAAAGVVGEYITAGSSSASITSATATNVTSVVLTAGDWDVDGSMELALGAGASATIFRGSLSTTTLVEGGFGSGFILNVPFVAATTNRMATPTVRLSLTTTTTVYLVGYASFSGGTATSRGYIHARRVR